LESQTSLLMGKAYKIGNGRRRVLEVASGAAALVVTASLARDLAGPNPVCTQEHDVIHKRQHRSS
jgi:hypothetical protein